MSLQELSDFYKKNIKPGTEDQKMQYQHLSAGHDYQEFNVRMIYTRICIKKRKDKTERQKKTKRNINHKCWNTLLYAFIIYNYLMFGVFVLDTLTFPGKT